MSNFAADHNRLFSNLEHALDNDMATIAVQANGGRSILFCYPHEEDNEYIAEGKQRLSADLYEFADVREIFSAFVQEIGESKFERLHSRHGKGIFFSEDFSEGTFFHYLMNKLGHIISCGKSPVLIHTGAIFDMGFSNINIMESSLILNSNKPLIVFYPCSIEGETIKFLGIQVASRYRCIVVK